MNTSMITIGGHMTDRVMCDAKGSPASLGNLYPSLYQFRLKLFDKDSTGAAFQIYPNVTALSASIGLVYAEPRAGTFKLRYGVETPTDEIDSKDSAEDFRDKLIAAGDPHGLDVVYSPSPSTWVCRFLSPPPSPALVPLNAVENELEPETFVRFRQFIQNNDTWVEVRLLQGPIASTNDLGEVLPLAPTVRTIRDGYTQDDGIFEIKVNEIQALTVSPDFTGTYIIKYQGRQTAALSATDGPQNIQDALNAMYDDTQTRFKVTNPEVNNAYVEFVGPFSGLNMEELEVFVASTGLLDISFPLNLYTTEVAEALVRSPEVEAIFEVRLHVTDPSIQPPEVDPGQDLVLFQSSVVVVRPLHWEGLEEAAPINWLYPPNPTDYIPYTPDQVGFGAVNYSIPFGDGVLHSFSIAHDLNSSNLQVSVRENHAPGGRQLRDDEFSVVFDDLNALTITIPGAPPATDSLIAVILSSGLESVFSPHHHTIDQIDGLRELLDSILLRLSALEDILPNLIGPGGGSVFGATPEESVLDVKIDDEWDLIPTNRPPGTTKFDSTKLAPAGLLLPAVHDVVDLGVFTADPATNQITLSVAHSGLVAGQRARIYQPVFEAKGPCTFNDPLADFVYFTSHGLANGRRVKFLGGSIPTTLSTHTEYYVINSDISTTNNHFQISATLGGDPLVLTLPAGTPPPSTLYTVPEVPGGLSDSVDYYMLAPTSTVFKLSKTRGGTEIDITTAGYPILKISTVEEAPSSAGILPPPGPLAGNVYAVKEDIFLRGTGGIRSETVHDGDFIASDGRVWYHVTRSDVPGSNSFYPNAMEKEIIRMAISENMIPASAVFTLTFELAMQMFKHDTNVQYMLVVEIGELPQDVTPGPTGPNLLKVDWNPTPLMQQRIIVTDIMMNHHFGAQVLRKSDGELRTNKKQYSVETAGDVIPLTPNFAIRVRLIEFDTEDNVADSTGLIYYTLTKSLAGITNGTPLAPTSTLVP